MLEDRDKAIVVFVLVTYGLSIALALVIGLTGGHESGLKGLGLIAMFFPALALVLVRFVMGERVPALGLRSFPLAYLPLALLLMPGAMHAVMLPLAAGIEGGLPWSAWLTPRPDGFYHVPDSLGWGTLTRGELFGRIALNAGVGLLIVSALAFFEEVGWRAWLLPRLVRRIGTRRGVCLAAAIWAFWHTPFALSGIHHIEGVPAGLVALIMPVGHIGAGLVLGWFWLRTGSIWIVTLAHGALNNWGQYAFKFMAGSGEYDGALLGAGSMALLVVGVALVSRVRC